MDCEYKDAEESVYGQIDTYRKPADEFVGFMVGGNANKKMVISEAAQDRINRIFADSESDQDDDLINKLDLMEKDDLKIKDKEPKLKFNGFTG